MPGLSARRRSHLLAAALLAAGVVCLLGRVLWGGEVIIESDLLTYYLPLKTAIHDLFRGGRSLLWNPLLGEGQPLAANPEHAFFYPFTWLLFVLPVPVALALTELAHLVLSLLGVRRLLRRLRLSEGAALLGAATWAFGGPAVSSLHFLPLFYAWTWIPWFAASALEPEGAGGHACARGALFGGLLVLAGEPVSLLLGGMLFGAALLSRPVTRQRLRRAAVISLLAAGLGAVTLLSGAALARKGSRGPGLTDAVANVKSFPPLRLSELLVPELFGKTRAHDDRLYLGWTLYPERGWPFFWELYSGALLLPLAAAGLVWRRRRILIFLLAAILAAAISLGPPGLLWSALRHALPPWRAIRFPEKFILLALFCLVVAMAHGFDAVRHSPRRLRAVALAALAVGFILVFGALRPAGWPSILLRAGGVPPEVPGPALTACLRGALGPAAVRWFTAAAALLLLSMTRRGRAGGATAAAIILMASADVLLSSRGLLGSRPAQWVRQPPPAILRLKRVRPTPRVVDFLPQFPPGGMVLHGNENIEWRRNRLLLDQPVGWGVPLALDADFDLTYIRAADRARFLMHRLAQTDIHAFAAALAGRSACAFLEWNTPVTLTDPVTPLAVRGCRPEVDPLQEVLRFQGDAGFLEAARAAGDRLARAALVEGDPGDLPDRPAESHIEDVVSRDALLRFRVISEGTSLIRIARTNDGNWRAAIDGTPARVRTVDLSLMAVVVPPGRHEVRLTYVDRVLQMGEMISALALAAVGILLAWRRNPTGLKDPGGTRTRAAIPPRA